MTTHHLLLTVAIIWLFTLCPEVRMQKCNKINSCSCSYEDKVVDLSPLTGNPKWADQNPATGTDMFSYNPCKPFTEGTCKDVAVCQNHGGAYYGCGTQKSAEFITGDGGVLILQYKQKGDDGTERTSVVQLQCIQSGPDELQVIGEGSTSGTFAFILNSVHCCLKARPPQSGGSGLSVGSIITIIFFTVLFVYVVAGILIQTFVRHMSGKEMMPNYHFWSSLPGLIKDGFLFVLKRGKVDQRYSGI